MILARWGQPRVIGEILAGILLGPTFFGWIAPAPWRFVFPPASLPLLNIVSQFGLILFMFLVAMGVDASHIRSQRGRAVTISVLSIAAPFISGVGLALTIRDRLAPPGASTFEFAFFLGVAMSVTAFPVLARILDETGLIRTRLGAIAIACAAVDDVAAWVLLATGIALARRGSAGNGPAWTIALLIAYAALMLMVRPLLARLVVRDGSPQQ